jgi:GxxExxY protein
LNDEISGGLSGQVIGAAIEVHRNLGPGLLESIYQEALATELGLRQIRVARELAVPVEYKGARLKQCLRLDL